MDRFTSDLSKKLDPTSGGAIDYSNWYQQNQIGKGIPLPFPFADWKKGWNVLTAPGLFSPPKVSAMEGKAWLLNTNTRLTKMLEAADHRTHGLNERLWWKVTTHGYIKGCTQKGFCYAWT